MSGRCSSVEVRALINQDGRLHDSGLYTVPHLCSARRADLPEGRETTLCTVLPMSRNLASCHTPLNQDPATLSESILPGGGEEGRRGGGERRGDERREKGRREEEIP